MMTKEKLELKTLDDIFPTDNDEWELENQDAREELRRAAIEWIKYYLEMAVIELKEYYLHDINPNKISKYIELKGKIEALMEFFDIDKNDLKEVIK